MFPFSGAESCKLLISWRDGRVAEGARLESVFRGNSNVGSNPTLSASSFAFNELSAIHTVVHTVKPFLGAVCDAILPSVYPDSRRSRQEASAPFSPTNWPPVRPAMFDCLLPVRHFSWTDRAVDLVSEEFDRISVCT